MKEQLVGGGDGCRQAMPDYIGQPELLMAKGGRDVKGSRNQMGPSMTFRSMPLAIRRLGAAFILALVASACDTGDGHNKSLSAALTECRSLVSNLDRVVHDDRQALLVRGKSPYNTYAEIAQRRTLVEAASGCLLGRLNAPEELIVVVRDSERSDGMRVAEWGTFRVVWQESPANGLEVGIGRRGATPGETIDFEYP